MFSNHYYNNDLIHKTKFIITFSNKYYFTSYYNSINYFYGVITVIANRGGIFDIYKLNGVNFVSENILQIQPSLSLDSNKSTMYIHNNNNNYDLQIIFTDRFSHGNVIFGGSVADYNNIIWYE